MSVGLNTNIQNRGGFEEIGAPKTEVSTQKVVEKAGDHQTQNVAPAVIKESNKSQGSPSPSLTRRGSLSGQLSSKAANSADKTHDASTLIRPARPGQAERQAKASSEFKEALSAAKEMLPNQSPAQRAITLTALSHMVRSMSISGGRGEARAAVNELHSQFTAKTSPPVPPRSPARPTSQMSHEMEAMALKNGISFSTRQFISPVAEKSLAQELEGAPERIQTRLPEEAHEIFATEAKFQQSINTLASLGDPAKLGGFFDKLQKNASSQDKALLGELKQLSADMRQHHVGFMHQLSTADNAKSFESKAEIWSKAFSSNSFKELDKDLARYATLYNSFPDKLKTDLGNIVRESTIRDLVNKPPGNLSEKQLSEFSTVGFDFRSIKDLAKQKIALDVAVLIGNTQKEFGDTLMAPVQRGMRYGMLLSTVAESAAKAPNLQEVSKTLSQLSSSVNSLHKGNDQVEAASSGIKNAKPLENVKPRMTTPENNFRDLSKGLISSIKDSGLSKSQARPQLEMALQQIMYAHYSGQGTKEELTGLLTELKQLPQAKEFLGTLTGSASFKSLVQSTEKLVQTSGSASGQISIVKQLALGNGGVAEASSYSSLLSPVRDFLGALARDPTQTPTAASNLLSYVLEGTKHPDFKMDAKMQGELKEIALQAQAMGMSEQANALLNLIK